MRKAEASRRRCEAANLEMLLGDKERELRCCHKLAALGGFLYGYDIGATSGATISLKSSTFSGTTWYNLSSVQTGLVVSGSLYGALIGSVLAFTIADFLGRRKELILASISYLIGALLTAVAPNFPMMVVGRFLYGIGIGLAMHAAPMYIAETAPSQKRGIFISPKEFFIVLGMLLGYIADNLYVQVVSGWRYMYATSTPLCLIMGVGMCWLPASPRWLLLCAIQGKGNLLEIKENATRCLCRLRPASPDLVSEQVNLFLDELSYVDQEKETCFSEIFRGKCLKAMIIGCGLVFFQQVTGQPSVLYYAATILQSAGFSGASDATRVSILVLLKKKKHGSFEDISTSERTKKPARKQAAATSYRNSDKSAYHNIDYIFLRLAIHVLYLMLHHPLLVGLCNQLFQPYVLLYVRPIELPIYATEFSNI